MKLKPFGYNCSSYEQGYTLNCLLSHLDALSDAESELLNKEGPRSKRLDLVEAALRHLNEAAKYEEE